MFGFVLLTHEIIMVLQKQSSSSITRPPPSRSSSPISLTRVPIGTGNGRKPYEGTIWVVPHSCDDIRGHLQGQFCALFGISGTSAIILANHFNYETSLPKGPFMAQIPGEDAPMTAVERQRAANMVRNFDFLSSTMDVDAIGESSVPSLLLLEPSVSLIDSHQYIDELPVGAHVIIGTRDHRGDNYHSHLYSVWQEASQCAFLRLKEIIYVVREGWTRHPAYSRIDPSMVVEEWRPSPEPLQIVHLAYLVYTKAQIR